MEDNMGFWVELEKTWFYNGEEETLLQKYNTIGLITYSILRRTTTVRNTIPICINEVGDLLKINKKDNNRFITKIKKSVIDMNNNLFVLYEDTNCTKLINIKETKLNNSTRYYGKLISEPLKNKFMMIYDNEIDKLIDYVKDKKISVEDILTHYIFICNGFKGKKKDEENPEGYKCWYGTYESITKKIGLVKNTLINNNKIFLDLNLLLIANAGGKIIENNKYENTSNVYAKVGSKKEFNTYMEIKKKQINKCFEKNKDKEQQDKQRRLKQLCNIYVKQNNIFDINDLKDEQFEELNKLELTYYNFVISRGKKPVKPKFITIKRDGTTKKWYDTDEEECTKEDISQNIEKETPQVCNENIEEESWEGNEEIDIEELMKDDEEDDINTNIEEVKELYKLAKFKYENYNENIRKQFNDEFKNIKFTKLKEKDIANITAKLHKFFNKADGLIDLDSLINPLNKKTTKDRKVTVYPNRKQVN